MTEFQQLMRELTAKEPVVIRALAMLVASRDHGTRRQEAWVVAARVAELTREIAELKARDKGPPAGGGRAQSSGPGLRDIPARRRRKPGKHPPKVDANAFLLLDSAGPDAGRGGV